MLRILHSYCVTQSDHDIMIIVKIEEDSYKDFSVKKSNVLNALVADCIKQILPQHTFNQDALNILPDDGDISTHSVSVECVMPESSTKVDNINSACGNESMQILVPVNIQ